MPQITLTEEQARIIREAREPVVLTDATGTVRIVSEPPDAVVLAEYHRDKLSGVEAEGVPSEKVGFYLKAMLAERERLGGHPLDEAYAKEFLARLKRAEAA